MKDLKSRYVCAADESSAAFARPVSRCDESLLEACAFEVVRAHEMSGIS